MRYEEKSGDKRHMRFVQLGTFVGAASLEISDAATVWGNFASGGSVGYCVGGLLGAGVSFCSEHNDVETLLGFFEAEATASFSHENRADRLIDGVLNLLPRDGS